MPTCKTMYLYDPVPEHALLGCRIEDQRARKVEPHGRAVGRRPSRPFRNAGVCRAARLDESDPGGVDRVGECLRWVAGDATGLVVVELIERERYLEEMARAERSPGRS